VSGNQESCAAILYYSFHDTGLQSLAPQKLQELERLEAAKREVEAKLGQFEAQISFRKQAVYDVDVIQRALQQFSRFIYRIPLECRVRQLFLPLTRIP
jgi:hypothetical protein